jgi:hypothetical protein
MADPKMKLYKGIYWHKDAENLGERIEIFAYDGADAKRRIREKFGKDIGISVWNEEEASRPR